MCLALALGPPLFCSSCLMSGAMDCSLDKSWRSSEIPSIDAVTPLRSFRMPAASGVALVGLNHQLLMDCCAPLAFVASNCTNLLVLLGVAVGAVRNL